MNKVIRDAIQILIDHGADTIIIIADNHIGLHGGAVNVGMSVVSGSERIIDEIANQDPQAMEEIVKVVVGELAGNRLMTQKNNGNC
jgi:hypothetical protein